MREESGACRAPRKALEKRAGWSSVRAIKLTRRRRARQRSVPSHRVGAACDGNECQEQQACFDVSHVSACDSRVRDHTDSAAPRHLVCMRGASLVESTLVLVLIAIVSGMSVPRAAGLYDRLMVERHTQSIVTAYERARLAALLGSSAALLWVQPDRVSVWRLGGGDSTLAWHAPGPASDGVSITGPSRVVFAPGGVTLGVANGTFVVTRGGISRRVVASRLGRLRSAPRRVRRRGRCGPRCSRSS